MKAGILVISPEDVEKILSATGVRPCSATKLRVEFAWDGFQLRKRLVPRVEALRVRL